MKDKPDYPIDRLLGDLAAAVARQDRGMLADVRRGFSEATEIRAYPYIAPYCNLVNRRERRICLTVAAGYATLGPAGLTRQNCGNLGATMRRLALEGGGKPNDALKTFEGRFRRLLSCQTAEDLCDHLTAILRAAAAKSQSVDFRQLFGDLTDWNCSVARDVCVEWAKGYWGVRAEPRKEDATCTT